MAFSKKFYIILNVVLCLLFLSSFSSYSQTTYKVTYKIENPTIAGSLEDQHEQLKRLTNKIMEYTKTIKYVLLVNQKESIFEEEEFLVKGTKDPLEDIYAKGAKLFASFKTQLYANYVDNTIIFSKNLLNQEFVVKREPYNFNWEIKDATKRILGFQARKAEGKYFDPVKDKEINLEAWFVPAIPLQSGPDIYMGLPGLIMELHLPRAVVKAKKIEEVQDITIEKPDEKGAMTQQEYEDLLLRLNKKFIHN